MPVATTANVAEQNLSLTSMLDAIKRLQGEMLIIHYATSDYVPNINSFYQIPDPKTKAGFYVVCHPSMQHRLSEVYPSCRLIPYSFANGG